MELPLEIIEKISTYLDIEEYNNLRLTSKLISTLLTSYRISNNFVKTPHGNRFYFFRDPKLYKNIVFGQLLIDSNLDVYYGNKKIFHRIKDIYMKNIYPPWAIYEIFIICNDGYPWRLYNFTELCTERLDKNKYIKIIAGELNEIIFSGKSKYYFRPSYDSEITTLNKSNFHGYYDGNLNNLYIIDNNIGIYLQTVLDSKTDDGFHRPKMGRNFFPLYTHTCKIMNGLTDINVKRYDLSFCFIDEKRNIYQIVTNQCFQIFEKVNMIIKDDDTDLIIGHRKL